MAADELGPTVSRLFARSSGRTTCVGIEQELLVSDATGHTVPVSRLRAALDGCPGQSHLGFEPGGQLELSLPPESCPCDALDRLDDEVADVRNRLDVVQIQAVAEPVDERPERMVPLRLWSSRYLRMQRHFDTIGPAGRRMMRRTASTQVCLDWWRGPAGDEQWRVLNLAAPFLAATFSRSTGPASRLATWLAVDPTRTAFDDRLLHGDDLVAAYVRFAAGATTFVDGGPAEHLTTLFPPVRPRQGYLEVRFLDAQEGAGLRAAVQTLATLAYDDERRRQVLRLLSPARHRLGEVWAAAAAGDAATIALGREVAGRTDVESAA